MSYAQHLTPRPEVLSEDGIEGIIDLHNLEDRRHRKLEARPEAFLNLTYPTTDVKRVIQRLNDRFSRRSDTSALFLFEGLKGSGKSHLLVLVYHLLRHAVDGNRWLSQHNLELHIPDNIAVIAHKYTDRPLLRLWDFIFNEAGLPIRGQYEVYPEDRQVLEALGDRQPQITVFASIYDAGQEPGATLVRVPNVRVQFARSTPADKARVVLHRLFQNFLAFDPTSVSGIIDSLLNIWRRFDPTFDSETFRGRMLESYPFHPELLTLILERVPQRGGFQNIRGSLGFLANLVRLTHETEDIITVGHATIRDLETATRLQDLDPGGDLINRAKANVDELAQYPLSERIAATTMLYTLTGEGRTRGVSREELIRHVMLPGADINDFEQTLLAFRKYASHFHTAEGRFFFDMEENADAKVEFRSLTIDPDGSKSKAFIREIWTREIFRDTESAVVFTNPEDTQEALEGLRKDRLRVVLAPRSLTPEERHDLYHGLSVRNQVLLLEPRARDFNLDQSQDLAKWARRCLAAKELRDQAERASDNARRDEYDRIGREDRRYIIEAIRRAGLVYVRFETYGASASNDRTELENLGNAATKEQVVGYISQQLFPVMVFQEHMTGRLDQVKNRLVREVDKEYRETLTFPVPTSAQSVTRAIRELCRLERIGLYHTANNYCGENPPLSESEIVEARIGDPVGTAPAVPPAPQPPADLARLEIQPVGPLTINPGDSRRLTVTSYDAQGRPLPEVNVAWRSADSNIASVSAEGVLTAQRDGETQITAVAGEIVSNAITVTVATGPAEQISIPFKSSKGALRQEIAARLAQAEGARIVSIRFQFFQADQEVDLSSLPAGLRGSMSGPGIVTFDVTIAKRGELTKAQVEQLCEQVPDFRSAQYSARLEIVRNRAQE